MLISGMSGNEIYCLSLKGLSPGEITVGNSVYSIGVTGALGSMGRSISGGEITQITQMISDGRHSAIGRMEQDAQKHGAQGVSGVTTSLGSLAGFTEFLSQGTAVHGTSPSGRFFSTAASGIELYCHLDAGYLPIKFAMGNIAYAIGVGRGLLGSFRTLARGEVREFSSMYNEIRHTALARLRAEASQAGANAVVDVRVQMLPYGPGTVELLLTGTASFHPGLSQGAVPEHQVATSELTGEELWNLAVLGYVPHQLVMATSVYSLGVASGIGARFRSLARGEIPEVTKLIYEARENCLELVRREAQQLGAEHVIGNRLQIRELSPGLIEVVALGTAVRRAQGMEPRTQPLIPQAVIVDGGSRGTEASISGLSLHSSPMGTANALTARMGGGAMGGRAIGIFVFLFVIIVMCLGTLIPLMMSQR